jgi:hypothetical protein
MLHVAMCLLRAARSSCAATTSVHRKSSWSGATGSCKCSAMACRPRCRSVGRRALSACHSIPCDTYAVGCSSPSRHSRYTESTVAAPSMARALLTHSLQDLVDKHRWELDEQPIDGAALVQVRSEPVAAVHCAALHCTALHCTALHCTALHCTAYCGVLPQFVTAISHAEKAHRAEERRSCSSE